MRIQASQMMARASVILIAGALALGACVVDSSPAAGQVDFTWLFEEQGCAPAGVSTVGIQILDVNGNPVVNDTVACSLNGITYPSINDGDYTFQMQGSAADGSLLYSAGGSLTVHSGDNAYDVNLLLAQ